jgi:hypothetical protein
MPIYTEFREKLALLHLTDDPENRHLNILAWLTEFAEACGCEKPILVGCGAIEIYTDAATATGDVDLVVSDISKLSKNLLKVGFQRASDPRYLSHPGRSILLEFPADSLRSGEESVTITHDGVECLVISPLDLILDRLESFEASGGGVDLVHAYLIYHLHYENIDHERLKLRVRNRDVLESFRFVKRLHDETMGNNLPVSEQGRRLANECRRRRGDDA